MCSPHLQNGAFGPVDREAVVTVDGVEEADVVSAAAVAVRNVRGHLRQAGGGHAGAEVLDAAAAAVLRGRGGRNATPTRLSMCRGRMMKRFRDHLVVL